MTVDLPPSSEVQALPPALLEIMRVMRQSIEETFSVNTRDSSFARLGAMMAMGVPPGAIKGHVDHLIAEGLRPADIWAVLYSIIGHIGMPRFVSMVPALVQVLDPCPEGGADP